jgi:2-C-methyl-D-erythritol 2,4-cyclodiphosphate synthase
MEKMDSRRYSLAMAEYRIGHGYDIHRLQSGGRLMMGMVCVSEQMSAIAHSDGDVVVHAIVDAILGALAKGDIGEIFPNTHARWKNAASNIFLEEVWKEALTGGWSLANLDVTILAERPRLKEFKQKMRENLTSILDAELDQINVKAGTNEGCDAIGKGEAVACHAVVMLVRSIQFNAS